MKINTRLIVTLFLGFASGLPLALSGSTLQLWFTTSGVSLLGLGLLNLVGIPYTYKFLWSPLMDRFQLPWFGRRRGWIILSQVGLIFILGVMAYLNPANHALALSLFALCLAFLSASQDIAVDAYRTDLLLPTELGAGNALYTTGYRVAVIISSGLAIALAGFLSWRFTYLLMTVLVTIGIIAAVVGPEPTYQYKSPLTLKAAVVEPFKAFLKIPYAYALLLFIVLYKLTDAFTLSLLGPFLSRALHFSLEEIGLVYKTTSLIATFVGLFLGAYFLKRLGTYRSLFYFGILQGLTALGFLILFNVGKNLPLMIASVFMENACSGMGTVAFVSFIMSLCDHRYTATQFALLSSLSAIGRVYIGPITGYIANTLGWKVFFCCGFFAAFPALILLIWLQNKLELIRDYSPVGEN